MPAAESLETFDMNAEDMPMDPASFLPLMLQAQDLVSKLESRVVELENDLETINEAHEQERDQLLQEIGEKDEHIHNLKTKVSRLEFGAREAIVVLARMVETLKAQASDDDDDDGKDDDDATAVESADLEGQFLDSIKLCLNYLKTSQNSVKTRSSSNKLKRFQELEHAHAHKVEDVVHAPQIYDDEDEEEMLHRQEADLKAAAPQTPVRRDSKLAGGSDRDEQPEDFLEADVANEDRQRRPSFCSSHVTLDDISLDGYELDGSEEITAFSDSDDEDRGNYGSRFGRKQRPSVGSVERPPTTRQNTLTNDGSNVSVHDDRLNLPIHQELQEFDDDVDGAETVQEEEEEDDDLLVDNNGLRPPEPIPDITTSNGCTNCAALLVQLDSHIEERAYLKRDLAAIASDLSEEQGMRAQIQASKECLEQEIDDWVNAMFEKVNQMMYDEAGAREDLEILNREFKGRHDGALKASQSREDRLREMKLLLVHLDATKQRQATSTPVGHGMPRNSVARRSIMCSSPFSSPRASRNFGHMSPSLFAASMEDYMFSKTRKIYIDGVVYEEFQDYIKSFSTSPSAKDLNVNSPFLKRCTQEDIQPCLFEGNTSWKSPFYKRRLLDAIMKNQCEIQAINYSTTSTPNTSQMSHNSNPSTRAVSIEPPPAPKAKCALCGQSRSCEFRMRLSGPDAAVPPTATTLALSARQRLSVTGSPGWMPIDRFCRDRVVAVCDFYAYLSHVRQGLLSNSPVWSMYKQCLKHRRKMSLARIGSMSMFEQDEAQEFENADMEGMVVVVH